MDVVKYVAAGLPLFLISLAVWTPLFRSYGVAAVYAVTIAAVAITALLVRTQFVQRRSGWLEMSCYLGLVGGVGAAAGDSEVVQGWDRLVWILVVIISLLVCSKVIGKASSRPKGAVD